MGGQDIFYDALHLRKAGRNARNPGERHGNIARLPLLHLTHRAAAGEGIPDALRSEAVSADPQQGGQRLSQFPGVVGHRPVGKQPEYLLKSPTLGRQGEHLPLRRGQFRLGCVQRGPHGV